MTDNIVVGPSRAPNAVAVATDDIGGVHYPIYKTAFGADGSVTQVNQANPLPIDCAPLAMGEIYEVAGWKYFGEAQPGADITASVWRISRMNTTTKKVEWADGNANFDNPYTDVTQVTVTQTYI